MKQGFVSGGNRVPRFILRAAFLRGASVRSFCCALGIAVGVFANSAPALAAPPFQASLETIADALLGNAAALSIVQSDLNGADPTAFLNNIAARVAALSTISMTDVRNNGSLKPDNTSNPNGIADTFETAVRTTTVNTINTLSTRDLNGNGIRDILEGDSNGDGISDAAVAAANFLNNTMDNMSPPALDALQQILGGNTQANAQQNLLINTALAGSGDLGLYTLLRGVGGNTYSINILNVIFGTNVDDAGPNPDRGFINDFEYRFSSSSNRGTRNNTVLPIISDAISGQNANRIRTLTELQNIMNSNTYSTSGDAWITALINSYGGVSVFVDTDGDGIPDETDTDDDNDGIPDATDPNPLTPDDNTDTDGDGVPDVIDTDDDGDGCNDDDFDCDGIPDATDDDDDGDGIPDATDPDPQTPQPTPPTTPPAPPSTPGTGTTTGSSGSVTATGATGASEDCENDGAELTDDYAVDPCAWARDTNNIQFAQDYFGGEQIMIYLEDWWTNEYYPALRDMTAQIHAGIIDQSRQMGSLMDAMSQAQKAMMAQNMQHAAKKDIKIGEQNTCSVGSTGPALTQTYNTARAITQGLKADLTNNAQGAPGTPGEYGNGPSLKARFDDYCEYFLDPEANQGKNACPNPTTAGEIIDGDIDIEDMLLRDTIDMDKEEEAKAAQALLANLIQPSVYGRLDDDAVDTNLGRQWILRKERIESVRRVASEVVSSIIARRAAIPLPDTVSAGADVPPVSEPPPPPTSTPTGAPLPSKGSYDDFINAVGNRESGGGVAACSYGSRVGYTGAAGNSYRCVNSIGFVGRYQFGAAALTDLGCVKVGTGANANLANASNWTGRCGNNINDFLNSPSIQDEVVRRWFSLVWQRTGPAHGAACTTVAGHPLTASGILAGGHLMGPGNVNTFVRTGSNSCDKYGTCVTEYIDEFAGYDTPFMDTACNPGDITSGSDAFSPYTPPPARPVKDIIREIRQRAGVPDEEIAENPSYNEIMLALTKEHFFDPKYFVEMADNMGAMQYEEQSLDALISMSLQDIYLLQEQINTLIAVRAGLQVEGSMTPSAVSSRDKQ